MKLREDSVTRHAWMAGCVHAAVIALTSSVCATASEPPIVHEVEDLLASDGAEGDLFGYSTSISGNVVIIGAYRDDDLGDYSGSAYVFRNDAKGWGEETKLIGSDGAENDRFGQAVAIDGDVAVVGAPGPSSGATHNGAAYVYRFDGTSWSQKAKLMASDGCPGDMFGSSVSIAGDVLIVGARYGDDSGDNSGSAYIFRRDDDEWIQEAKLLAPDGAPGDLFGNAVATDGEAALVGAPFHDSVSTNCGAVYTFRQENSVWTCHQKLTASCAATDNHFGSWIDLGDDRALIGAPMIQSGYACLFRFDGASWSEEVKFQPPLTARNEKFGCGGAAGDSVVLVGAYGDGSDDDDRPGAAFVYRYDGVRWKSGVKLTASAGADGDRFGRSLDLAGEHAIVGAPRRDDESGGENTGAAYMYFIPAYDCNSNGIPDADDITSGVSDDCNGNDIPDECDISAVSSWDCNHNGTPDECDIADGTSEDVDADGVPDECAPPGAGGLLVLTQARSLFVSTWDEGSGWIYIYDEAPSFDEYDKSIETTVWGAGGAAMQQSSFALSGFLMHGDAEAGGCSGGGCFAEGQGATLFDIVFGSPVSQWVTLSGELVADGSIGGWTTSRIALTAADGSVLFEQQVTEEDDQATISERFHLQKGDYYTLTATAHCEADEGGYSAECDLSLMVDEVQPGDVTGDGVVDVLDLIELLAAWGPCPDPPNECPADLDGSGVVDVLDLLIVLGNWT